MIRWIVALGTATALGVCGCAGKSSGRERTGSTTINSKDRAPDPRTLPRTYVIFADVTDSLSAREHAVVEEKVQRIVEIMPPKATLIVFPILEDVERAPAIYTATLPDTLTTSDSVDFSVFKARSKVEVAKTLHQVAAGNRIGRKLTCISGALRKAEEVTIDARPSRPVEIIIVSDMLEDCNDSLLGGKLSLEKQSIMKEIKAARALPSEPLLHLNGASVTMLLATDPTSPGTTKRPAAHDLERFWREILDRSGDNRANFRFGTEVPQRLKELNTEAGSGL